MIKVENLSYSFPEKDLYKKVSFTIEEGDHIALIGSNGTGKSTLIDIFLHDDEYLYTGKIIKKENMKIAYVSQYVAHDKEVELTVYDYLCQDFLEMMAEQEAICKEMETATDFDEIMDRYQKSLDAFAAVDGDNYETNIHKQLKLAGLSNLADLSMTDISGGEYKLVQIIRQMMSFPDLLIMDEPDVFLDFANLAGLRNLIISYVGTILVITHNRFILNHCFQKILHLENADIQEFEGSYMDYQVALLSEKVDLQERAAKDQAEIERNEKLVNRLRAEATYIDNSGKGRQLKARASLLERLRAKAIKAPFVEVREPDIHLYKEVEENTELLAEESSVGRLAVEESSAETVAAEETILSVDHYSLAFDEVLLDDVSFEIGPHDKLALVGANGTGKTTLLRHIYEENKDRIKIGYLSQIYGNLYGDKDTVFTAFEKYGFHNTNQVEEFLKGYSFHDEIADQLISVLSGGERNLMQLALLNQTREDILLLDEPTSHLDTYSQIALERAIKEFPGALLMVSHDFYTIANCVDYVLYVEDKNIRKMSKRAFRKMIYKEHFSSEYIELEKKKSELEQTIHRLLRENNYEKAKSYCQNLIDVVDKMS